MEGGTVNTPTAVNTASPPRISPYLQDVIPLGTSDTQTYMPRERAGTCEALDTSAWFAPA